MTKDVIALTPKMPDIHTVLAGLLAGGPDLGINTLAEGAVVQLCSPGGRPLLSVEAPLLVQVPGEAARLLGNEVSVPEGPFWWTEARASTAVAEGEQLAGSFAGRLAAVLGGTVWPPRAAHTHVVPLTPETATAAPSPDAAPPAVDALTDQAAVVIQDRPLIAMTSWLADALPTRTALHGHPNRWVIQDPDHGYYDGLSGAQLHWQDGAFAPTRDENGTASTDKAFAPASDSGERQLILSLRTRHPADQDLTLGHALETAWQHLTGTPPADWSTAEPVNLPWNTRQLTDLARSRAPQPTWLIAVGHPDRPALATLRITRTPAGVEEDITLTLGYGKDETAPLDAIAPLAETLTAQHGLTTMLTSLRTARRDLTVPPHFETPPIPVSFTLGSDAVSDIGLAHARRPPLNLTPVQLGAAAAPALHYPLGDGIDPRTWSTLQQLTQHLKQT
ncbi:DUF6177 family protein [Streptomyces sp. NBC_00286]|uniref:DUF6177 family protein n=1 Tax=Streptomyces sp. NBC_00286 TaxID=2975701 RepID=UPI002E2A2AB2|nr:DUF6177 family protein [Streptomyces sp. NBC_00286]